MKAAEYERRSDLWCRLAHQLAARACNAFEHGDLTAGFCYVNRRRRALHRADECWFMATSELAEVD